jgi:hypothetical protein
MRDLRPTKPPRKPAAGIIASVRGFFTDFGAATDALGGIATSMAALETRLANHVPPPPNTCPHCITANGGTEPSTNLSDTGECGQCGRIGDVYDLELLGLYQGMGISAGDVWQHLPRLRQRYAKDTPMASTAVGEHLRAFLHGQHRGTP